jgi:hypothetical protein
MPSFLKKALHHKSLESQIVYTEPDRVKLNRAIDAALARAEKAEDGTVTGAALTSWPTASRTLIH